MSAEVDPPAPVAMKNTDGCPAELPVHHDGWELMPEVRAVREAHDGARDRKLGVTWTNLTIKGVGVGSTINENAVSQFNFVQRINEMRQSPSLRTIVDASHGCVKPGEMLLVLGRPGAGCTTLLKVLANRRAGYASVEGDVKFGSLDHDQAAQYRGQIVMNTEEELFFPSLTAGQTLDFATRMKVPADATNPADYQRQTREFLLKAMGIEHTRDTRVGNEFVRGVSGGERKRVSIIETMATRGSVYCWDSSTRGLDASTALGYAKSIRAMTDIFGLASIVTLYQAGNGIYSLFDKVLLLDDGQQLYYGPMKQARPFMEELGFIYDDGANVADFMTGVTVPTERKIRRDVEMSCPRTADDIRAAYERSPIYESMHAEYDYPTTDLAKERTYTFCKTIQIEKDKSLPVSSPLTVSFLSQVRAAIVRQY
jgi:ATP-binding cassette subfamily G (WHITE) protein 2 (SNQ2)